ncbi:MAG TPA: hypothetical protein DCP37_16295 [Dehalococcoidia bacterium]|nr:hypothetical protein [Dehalococcoidia bacterium]
MMPPMMASAMIPPPMKAILILDLSGQMQGICEAIGLRVLGHSQHCSWRRPDRIERTRPSVCSSNAHASVPSDGTRQTGSLRSDESEGDATGEEDRL